MPRPRVQAHREAVSIVVTTRFGRINEPRRWACTRAFCTRRVLVWLSFLTRHTAFRYAVWPTLQGWNPVKHGLVPSVRDWPWSTFHRHVQAGQYDIDWGRGNPCPGYDAPEWE